MLRHSEELYLAEWSELKKSLEDPTGKTRSENQAAEPSPAADD
jgi:hypothetical protein